MSMLRDHGPRPVPRTRKLFYPRAFEVGALLLPGACSRGSDNAQEPPYPPPTGSVASPITEAPPAGTVAVPMTDAAALPAEAGSSSARVAVDAGASDGGKRTRAVRPTPVPRPAGDIATPFESSTGK